jgi:hypothetical protein
MIELMAVECPWPLGVSGNINVKHGAGLDVDDVLFGIAGTIPDIRQQPRPVDVHRMIHHVDQSVRTSIEKRSTILRLHRKAGDEGWNELLRRGPTRRSI